MRKNILLALLFLINLCSAQQMEDNDLAPSNLKKSIMKFNRPYLDAVQQGDQASLISIDIVANSTGPIAPRFIFKGYVDNAVYIQDSVAFTNSVGGASLSSVSPDDGGQFFISAGNIARVGRLFHLDPQWLTHTRSAIYEIRFGADDAGLAFNYYTGEIVPVPFTAWNINGTPNNPDDDEPMLIVIANSYEYAINDSRWGIRNTVSPWIDNPAHESTWTYLYHYVYGTGPDQLQAAYSNQEISGIVDEHFYTSMLNDVNIILARITINSLDQNPLTLRNSLNNLSRPAAGTIIQFKFTVPLGFIDQSLYTAAGQNFVFQPITKGNTRPTVSAIQLPPGMTFNAVSGELNWTADTSQTGYHTLTLQATNEQGSVQGTYTVWVDRFPWEFANHNNNNVVFSVFNNGCLGKAMLKNSYDFTGNGFTYYSLNALYAAQLYVALSASQISGMLYSWQNVHRYATESPVISSNSLIEGFSQCYTSEYSDKRAPHPMGIKIIQHSYSRSSSPDDDYVIIEYDILNQTSAMLSGVYAGIFADWDVGIANHDLAGYDASRQLSYIYEADRLTNTYFYGMSLLKGIVSGHRVDMDVIPEDTVFASMQNIYPVPRDTTDYRPLLSTGPYNIAAGKSIRVVYALAAGSDLLDLQTNIDAARAINLNRKPVVANPIGNKNLVMGTNFVCNLTTAPPVFKDLDEDALSFTAQSSNSAVAQASVAGSILTVQPKAQGNASITVQANDGNGGTESTSFSVSVSLLPAVNTTAASNITPVSAQFNATVSPAGQECQVFFEYGTSTSYGDTAWADQNPISGNLDVTPTATVYNLEIATPYNYRAVALLSSLGKSIGSNVTFTTEVYPANVRVNKTYNFPTKASPGDYVAQDYQIIGFPGRATESISTFINGTEGQDWEVYWDNGASSNYMIKYDGGGSFTLAPGKAFWIVHKGDWSTDYTLSSVLLNSNKEAEIPLQKGWNLITNPFAQKMYWTSVQSLNGISDPIWSYQGTTGFQQEPEFAPFQGYYYFNSGNASLLRISYRELFINPVPKSVFSWQGQLCLETAGTTDAACWFGVSTASERGLDKLDFRKPRTVGDLPAIYFPHPDWDNAYSTFGSDIRPEIEKLETWPVEVYIPATQTDAVLSVQEVSNIPASLEVYLLDKESLRYQNMRDNPRYDFKAVKNISRFDLVIGNKEAVLAEIDKIVPVKFALGQNFPNPFNPATTIPVAIPAASRLTVTIYNTLGQEIITLFKGTLDVGRHYLTWDGTGKDHHKMPSGIYLYRLSTEKGLNLTGKMVLIK
jgi:hypothetical protein